MTAETLSVTFTYSHTRGVFTGYFHNGASFDFIAAPDAPMPTKLRNALHALSSRAHTEFKRTGRRPEMSDEDWNALMDKIAEYEATYGVTRHRARGPKAQRVVKHTSIDIGELDV